jgi:hypothetical protein
MCAASSERWSVYELRPGGMALECTARNSVLVAKRNKEIIIIKKEMTRASPPTGPIIGVIYNSTTKR